MVQRIALMLVCFSLAAAAQTSPKAAPKAKPPAHKSSPAAKSPEAIIHTTAGEMKCQLFPDKAPLAVANFIGLATGKKDWTDPATGQVQHGKPLYNGVIFHRVIPNFMIQGGDPLGTGTGGPGYKFNDELHADLLFDKPGRLAMANRPQHQRLAVLHHGSCASLPESLPGPERLRAPSSQQRIHHLRPVRPRVRETGRQDRPGPMPARADLLQLQLPPGTPGQNRAD